MEKRGILRFDQMNSQLILAHQRRYLEWIAKVQLILDNVLLLEMRDPREVQSFETEVWIG